MTDEPLKDYRLTPAARADLEAIWRYTAERWSVAQAEAYLTGLKAMLDGLIVNPRIARERTELTPPVRIHPYGSHIIIYTIATDHLAVIRVRHAREDWLGNPIGEG